MVGFNSFAQELVILTDNEITTGAKQTDNYVPLLLGKNVGVIANPTSVIGKKHLIDTLIALKVNVKKIFSPEHGFRGQSDAGEKVNSQKDEKTGIQIISLYGNHKKPTKEDLNGIDVLVYDMQDVGVRYYTYISTMTYCMEAAAENNIQFIVLDRPNPNGFYVDGPVLESKWKSFLGLHPVPIVYGMTCGEYATMINEEKWLEKGLKCNLNVIKLKGYNHRVSYELPVKPSPNLPNMTSVFLYPSLGLFEGTVMSLGRGTDLPFQQIGHPDLTNGKIKFTPKPTTISKKPKYENKVCNGFDLRNFGNEFIKSSRKIYLFWLIGSFNNLKQLTFFDENFNWHSGNSSLQEQIKAGKSEEEIRKSWENDLNAFKKIRKKYLLYDDFE
jgi:uncharacterized protein YbbC (DUF1343 family)